MEGGQEERLLAHAGSIIQKLRHHLSLNLLFDGQLRADINHQFFPEDIASLRAKLGHYPSGTKFQLTTFGEQDGLASVLRDIDETAVERSLIIEGAHWSDGLGWKEVNANSDYCELMDRPMAIRSEPLPSQPSPR